MAKVEPERPLERKASSAVTTRPVGTVDQPMVGHWDAIGELFGGFLTKINGHLNYIIMVNVIL